MRRLVATANVVLTLLIRVTLVKETLRSCDTKVLTKNTRRNITKDGILQVSHYSLVNLIALLLSSRQSETFVTKHLGF
jgi:hypothetical protein